MLVSLLPKFSNINLKSWYHKIFLDWTRSNTQFADKKIIHFTVVSHIALAPTKASKIAKRVIWAQTLNIGN